MLNEAFDGHESCHGLKPWMFVEGLSLKHVKLLVNQALKWSGGTETVGHFCVFVSLRLKVITHNFGTFTYS